MRDIRLRASDPTATLAALVPRLTAAVGAHGFIAETMALDYAHWVRRHGRATRVCQFDRRGRRLDHDDGRSDARRSRARRAPRRRVLCHRLTVAAARVGAARRERAVSIACASMRPRAWNDVRVRTWRFDASADPVPEVAEPGDVEGRRAVFLAAPSDKSAPQAWIAIDDYHEGEGVLLFRRSGGRALPRVRSSAAPRGGRRSQEPWLHFLALPTGEAAGPPWRWSSGSSNSRRRHPESGGDA